MCVGNVCILVSFSENIDSSEPKLFTHFVKKAFFRSR